MTSYLGGDNWSQLPSGAGPTPEPTTPNIVQFSEGGAINFTSDGGQIAGWNESASAYILVGPTSDNTPTITMTTTETATCYISNTTIEDDGDVNSTMEFTTTGTTAQTTTFEEMTYVKEVTAHWIKSEGYWRWFLSFEAIEDINKNRK